MDPVGDTTQNKRKSWVAPVLALIHSAITPQKNARLSTVAAATAIASGQLSEISPGDRLFSQSFPNDAPNSAINPLRTGIMIFVASKSSDTVGSRVELAISVCKT